MTTLNYIVVALADDAYENQGTGTPVINNTAGLFGASSTGANFRYTFGARFLAVAVPQGTVISVGYLTISAVNTSNDDPNGVLYCEDVDDSAEFTTDDNNVVGRALTTANASWVATSIGTGDVNSPSIVDALNEVFARASWVSGNDLTVLFKANSDAAFSFSVRSYDTSTTNCPRLHIEYTPAAAGNPWYAYAQM